MREEYSAGFVVFYGKPPLFLLLQYPKGHWDFPKGHLEKKEKESEAAVRELKEETGIRNPKILRGFRHEIKYGFGAKDGAFIKKTVTFFLAESKTRKIKVSFEHKGYAWLPFEQAVKRATYKNARELLKLAKKWLDKNGTIRGRA